MCSWFLPNSSLPPSGHLGKTRLGMVVLSQFKLLAVTRAMVPHSSTLWPGKSHGLRSRASFSLGSLKVGHDWATSLWLFTFVHWRRKWQSPPVFLPGESQGRDPGGLLSMGLAQGRTLKRLSSRVTNNSSLYVAFCSWVTNVDWSSKECFCIK